MDSKIIAALILSFKKSPEDAKKYLESQGIKITWNWEEAVEAIRKHAFTISKVTNADVLQMIHNELVKAMKDGKTYADFKKNLDPLLKDKGYIRKEDGSAWRLDTIYRNNMQSAYMAGRYKEQMNVADEFPYMEFVAIMDDSTTDICSDADGVILPSNHPFWKTRYPMLHHNCRSRVVVRNKEMLNRMGKVISKSDVYSKVKAAKGFDNSPGEWKPDLNKYEPKLKKQLQKVLA